MAKFDRIVSLGGYCLTKYQINRHICRKYFGMKENSTNLAARLVELAPKEVLARINGGNCIYDWVVVEDYDKLTAEIASGLFYNLSTAHLHEILDKNNKIDQLRCLKSGVVWVHLFSRANNLGDWVDQIPGLQSKVDRMIHNFKVLNEHKTAYIFTIDQTRASGDLPDRLYAALKKFRGVEAPDFALVVGLSFRDEKPEDRDGIFFRRVNLEDPDFLEYPWLGNAASWDKIFDEFTLSEPVREEWFEIGTLAET
jgi:hypothetical protein